MIVSTEDSLLEELLLEWQEARERGRPSSAEELCRQHPELLQPLREQISALEAMQALLDVEPGSPLRSVKVETSSASLPGSTPEIPGYETLILIGEGGMGAVYRARQLGLQRLVAIKMIR
jgi:eukaryotic-like serine/threonine-protein kinase